MTTTSPRGLTLVETLIGVSIFVLVLLAMVTVITTVKKSYPAVSAAQAIENSAGTGLERMVREIRNATSTDSTTSTYGSSPGQLMINTTDDSDTPITMQFFVSSQTLRMKQSGVDQGPLTGTGVRVTSLVFRHIATASGSEAVKIELTLETGQGNLLRSKKFYSTVTLRGSYAE